MAFTPSVLVACAFLLSSALAGPILPRENTAPVTPLTPAQITALTPFAAFTSAAYCSAASVQSWTCGAQCASLPGVTTLVTGGDNAATPDYYVAYYPVAGAIVVAHQGTNPENILSLIDDGEANLVAIDPTYFPGLSGLEVHYGFQNTFESSATTILATVKAGLATYSASHVFVVGHSLGAAVAVLDSLYLKEQLPASVGITTTVFGLPRVGNQAFANHVDATLPGLQHVVNDNDMVPRLPSTDFGYEHPSGEVFITAVGGSVYDACPGQENYNCAIGLDFFTDSLTPHDGPYAGIMMGSAACTA